jgi:cytochrome c oxidase subunit I+III
MFIMMLADITAFVSLLFGYFFYWSLRSEFPPSGVPGPGSFWPGIALLFLIGAWGLTIAARRWNRSDRTGLFYAGALGGALLALGGSAAIIAGPWLSGMDPQEHVYSATIWLIAIWTAVHVVIGIIMQLYCAARRRARRMTARHDIDICNTALYWHFLGITAVAAVAVMAVTPLLR